MLVDRHAGRRVRHEDERGGAGEAVQRLANPGRDVDQLAVVLGHDGDPLRVNSILFLPSSTYPLSMIFGMMYVPSRRS